MRCDDISNELLLCRLHDASALGNWKILTILGAIRNRDMIATMTIQDATGLDIVLAYLDEVLIPALGIFRLRAKSMEC